MKKFTTCNTSDKKKRHILRMLPVLTVAGALSIALTGCGTSSEDEVQRYSWPLATASPEDTVTQISPLVLAISVVTSFKISFSL